MAEKPSEQAKRRVKNPETFRERAIKAAESSDKPTRRAKVRKAIVGVLRTIFRPIGRAFGKLFSIPPFNFIAWLARMIGLVIFPVYLRNSTKELKNVTWPTFKQSRQLTGAVLIFAIVFGTSVALVDLGLDRLFKHILLK
jgi:preprotein translocase SecE subunit